MNYLISVDYGFILVLLLVIFGLVIFLYLLLVVLSCVFMGSFHSKIKKGRDSINVILYQKFDLIIDVISLIKNKLPASNPLNIFYQNDAFKKYNKIDAEEFDDFYKYSESLLKEIQKFYIDNNLGELKGQIDSALLTINELNRKYYESVQIYNSNVIGYNYWRNLYSTRWVKAALFIKEIKTIK